MSTTTDQTQGVSTTQGPAPEPEKQKTEPRPYVVLQKVAGTSPSAPQTWVFARNVQANSVEQAIRAVAELLAAASDEDSFTLVAVPARNFKPVTVTPEIKTSLKFS